MKFGPSALSPEGFQAEGWVSRLEGEDKYIVCDAAPIRTPQGELLAVIETIQDITQRKRAEDRLREIAHEVSARTGEDFFRSLVSYLSGVLKADYVLIGEFDRTITDAVTVIALGGRDVEMKNLSFFLRALPARNLWPKRSSFTRTVSAKAFRKATFWPGGRSKGMPACFS